MGFPDSESAVEVHPRLGFSGEQISNEPSLFFSKAAHQGNRISLPWDGWIDAESSKRFVTKARRRHQVDGFDRGEDCRRKSGKCHRVAQWKTGKVEIRKRDEQFQIATVSQPSLSAASVPQITAWVPPSGSR